MTRIKKNVSIKDVAEAAGVSISTVSHTLNGTKHVSEALQKKVLRAVNDLQYEVNLVARSLKSGHSSTIAVIVSSVTSVFFPPLLKSIQRTADQNSYTVYVFGTGGDLQKEKEHIHTATSQSVDGILLSSCVDTADAASQDYIQYLSELSHNGRRVPIICLESTVGDTLDAVVADDESGLYAAVNHLVSLGRKNIAYIAAPTRFTMGKYRREGYLRALRENGLSLDEALLIEGDYSPESGRFCMQQILDAGRKVDAVAAGNDQMAIGAMRAILDAGLTIPGDIAVIGYNDNFPASLVTPSLSTIHVPKREMGRTAFDLLLRRLETPEAPRMLVHLAGSLVVRNSTDPTVQTRWNLESW